MIRYHHSPTDSPHGGGGDSGYVPDARRDSPSNWPSLFRLRRTAPAYVSSPPRPSLLCPGTAGSWSLRPTRRPAPMRHSGLEPPDGGTGHSESNRGPDAPGETGPGRVSISTRPHHTQRTGAPVLPES